MIVQTSEPVAKPNTRYKPPLKCRYTPGTTLGTASIIAFLVRLGVRQSKSVPGWLSPFAGLPSSSMTHQRDNTLQWVRLFCLGLLPVLDTAIICGYPRPNTFPACRLSGGLSTNIHLLVPCSIIGTISAVYSGLPYPSAPNSRCYRLIAGRCNTCPKCQRG